MNGITVANGAVVTFRPGSFVTWKAASDARTAVDDAERVVALVGPADGGTPNQPYVVRTPEDAEKVLRAGELLTLAKLAFQPARDRSLRPAALILVNPVPGTPARKDFETASAAITLTATGAGPATGVTANLAVTLGTALTGPIPAGTRFAFATTKIVETTADFGAAGTTGAQSIPVKGISGAAIVATDTAAYKEAAFILTTVAYRDRANQVTYALTGSAAAGFGITINDPDNGAKVSTTNLGLAISLKYDTTRSGAVTGGPATATVQVVSSGGTKRLQTTVTSDGTTQQTAQMLDIPLTVGTAVRAIVDQINALGVYQAFALRDGTLDASGIDLLSSVTIKDAVVKLTATKADIRHYFTLGNGRSIVTFTDGPATAAPSAASGAFTRGTTGALTTADWSLAARALNDHAFGALVPATDDTAVVAGLRAVVADRNTALQGKYSMFFGGYPNASFPADSSNAAVDAFLATAEATLQGFNDYYSQIALSQADVTDPTSGLLRKAKTYEIAGMAAARRAAGDPVQSLTYRDLNVSNPFPVYDLTRSGEAVRMGAVVLENETATGPVRIVRDRTTFVGESNAVYESGQGVFLMNAIARGADSVQEQTIPGKSASKASLEDHDRRMRAYYEKRLQQGWLTEGKDPLTGEILPPFTLETGPTTDTGRRVPSKARVNPVLELIVGDHEIVAKAVEIEVS